MKIKKIKINGYQKINQNSTDKNIIDLNDNKIKINYKNYKRQKKILFIFI